MGQLLIGLGTRKTPPNKKRTPFLKKIKRRTPPKRDTGENILHVNIYEKIILYKLHE